MDQELAAAFAQLRHDAFHENLLSCSCGKCDLRFAQIRFGVWLFALSIERLKPCDVIGVPAGIYWHGASSVIGPEGMLLPLHRLDSDLRRQARVAAHSIVCTLGAGAAYDRPYTVAYHVYTPMRLAA